MQLYLSDNDEPFEGIVVILAGDFRKIFPIIWHGKRAQIIENTVKKIINGILLNL